MMDAPLDVQVNDLSNGYEKASAIYLKIRGNSNIGVSTVQRWAQTLPQGGTILDIGCGNGVPISQTLIELGFKIYGIDASASMTHAFSQRFPQTQVVCEAVEASSLFHRQFDGIISWGLFFLLSANTQLALIPKIANALRPGGRFLFTSPRHVTSWNDALTEQLSQSLGREVYTTALVDAGFRLIDEYEDEGGNHYYDAEKQ